MAERLNREIVAEKAIVHAEAPALRVPHRVDRSFELPGVVYGLTAFGYFGFVALAAAAFGNRELMLPIGIIVIFLVMFFGVNAKWVRMNPDNPQHATSWDRFQRDEIQIATGPLRAKDALIQVLLLPALILAWGVAVVAIAAFS